MSHDEGPLARGADSGDCVGGRVVGDLHTQVEVVDEEVDKEKVIYRVIRSITRSLWVTKDYESLNLITEVVGKVYRTEMHGQ